MKPTWKVILLIMLAGFVGWRVMAQEPQGTTPPGGQKPDAVTNPNRGVRISNFGRASGPGTLTRGAGRGGEPDGTVKAGADVSDLTIIGVPITSDELSMKLEKARQIASEMESASIHRANDARLSMERLDPTDVAGRDRLRKELRLFVIEAFKARHALQRMEVDLLAKKLQAMDRKLEEQETKASEIIERRIDDLLNPNLRWDDSAIKNSTTGRPGGIDDILPKESRTDSFLDQDKVDRGITREVHVTGTRISTVTIAAKTATVSGIGASDQECVLQIAESKRNKKLEWTTLANGQFTATVTASDQLPSDNGKMIKGIILTVRNPKSASTTNIAMSEGGSVPAGTVRFRQVSAIDRADTMVTIADILCDDGTTIPVSILLRDKVDRSNARTVVDAYIAAALADDTQTAALYAKGTPAESRQIESLPKQLNVQRLVIKSVYVNDPAKPTKALATSEAVKLTQKQPNGQRDGFLVLTLTMSEEGWCVTDIDFESEEGADDELKRFLEVSPNAVGLPPFVADELPGTNSDSRISPQANDKQLGIVLGKPIRESDLNKNTSAEDNLKRLLLAPLTENYCGKHGLDRAEELNAKIKDENSRRMVRMFVTWWELNRHLYEKHGGRVVLSAFGSTAVDGLKKWLEEREQAGDFEITDPELKAKYRELWIDEPVGVQFAMPDQLETAFDSASTDRFIEIYAKIPAGAHRDPASKLVGVVFGRPIYLRDRYLTNKVELPGLLYTLVVPELEERYRKQHPEVEPTDAEIDDLTARRKAGFIQAAVEQRKSLEAVLTRNREANPESPNDPRTLAAIKEVDDRLEKIQTNDGRFHAAELARQLKFQEHIFENYGGGRALSGGSHTLVLVDAQIRWLEERERLGEFQIADAELRHKLDDYWTNAHHPGARLIEDASVRDTFNYSLRGKAPSNSRPTGPASDVDSSRKSIVTPPPNAIAAAQKFPSEKVAGHIASIKQRTAVAEAVAELRKLTGLDFGDGVDHVSRQAWLKWWEHERSCIDKAKDGLREFVVTGVITANGKPVPGAEVQAHVPSKNSPNGQFQLAQTHSDSSGRYVLAMGIPSFAAAEESTWKATFTVRNPPHFAPDQEPIVMTLHRQKRDDTVEGTLEEHNETIFAGVPVEMNFKLQPGSKPPVAAGIDAGLKTKPSAPQAVKRHK